MKTYLLNINENQLKPKEIIENQWKSMKTNGGSRRHGRSLEIEFPLIFPYFDFAVTWQGFTALMAYVIMNDKHPGSSFSHEQGARRPRCVHGGGMAPLRWKYMIDCSRQVKLDTVCMECVRALFEEIRWVRRPAEVRQ